MKLDTTQVAKVHEQTGLLPVPECDSSQVRLEQHFGQHTFYVDPVGLYIWESLDPASAGPLQAIALKIASWANEDMTILQTHEPRETGTVVVLATVQ